MNPTFLTWFLLFVSIFVLALIPFVSSFLKSKTKGIKSVSKILNWLFAAVIALHLLPEVIGVAGYKAALVAVAGFALSLGLDSMGRKLNAWRYIPAVVFVGLSIHGFLDGFAIRLSSGLQHVHGIAEVVVFHRIFAGMFIWQVSTENYTKKTAVVLLSLLGVTTVLGFFFGLQMLRSHSVYLNISYIQAFILGGVLHIAFHRDVSSEKPEATVA